MHYIGEAPVSALVVPVNSARASLAAPGRPARLRRTGVLTAGQPVGVTTCTWSNQARSHGSSAGAITMCDQDACEHEQRSVTLGSLTVGGCGSLTALHLWFEGCQNALAPQPMQWHVQRLLRLLFALLNEALLIGHLPTQVMLR